MKIFANLKFALLSIASMLAFSILGANSASAVVQYEQEITPDIIFGSGNTNGSFTTDRRNGIEIGIRAKIPFVGTINSNSNGTYSYTLDETDHDTNAVSARRWNFDWTVNTNFDGSTALNISDLTYEMGLDGDPSLGTDFLVFDPITPNVTPLIAPFFDHAIGTNITGNGLGVEATDNATYVPLIDNNSVAQNSWRYSFFPLEPLASYNPDVDGTYAVYLLAKDEDGKVVARVDIQILIGNAQPVEPGADHLQCYDIDWSSKLDRRTVDLEDQFAVRENVRVKRKAEKYCTPVNKNGEGIINPDNHFTCYKVKGFKPKRKVTVENQFGEQTFKLKESELLCVPSTQVEVTEVEKRRGHHRHHHHHDDD
jgi:hypothetical protein